MENNLATPPASVYKDRIKAIKPTLKLWKGWKKQFLFLHSEYNNHEGLNLLDGVLLCRRSDVALTEKLETFIQTQKENAN
ncbi:MAG: hypothetical protein EBX41_09785 [Chitinophagia bacterium]|nr:hypothetical protein [Chitinophagia bacterium]